MTDDETAAVTPLNFRWIATPAWNGIEKGVTDQRSLVSKARNFEEWYKIALNLGAKYFVAIRHFLSELFLKK